MGLNLFDLPSELRYNICEYVFADNDITPEKSSEIFQCSCTACAAVTPPRSHRDYYQPALVSKQFSIEAKPFLESFTLHISQPQVLERIYKLAAFRRSQVKDLVLYLHLDDLNRMEWLFSLDKIGNMFANLRNLTIHNHMRPPTSYENLVDGIFLAAPLVGLRNSVNQVLHFDYTMEDVMFSSPFLGEIRYSDALEEHELVVRDLLQDATFRLGASRRDITHMTAALLRIARAHEHPWFERLQRRRLEQLARNVPPPSDSAQSS